MKDYTDTQAEPVIVIPNMPTCRVASAVSEEAQALYRSTYGPRPAHVHVAGSKRDTWHLGHRWYPFLSKYPDNKMVFVNTGDSPYIAGWLYHYEIPKLWFDCGAGHCISGLFRSMESFVV